jgi:hypothetical protein
MTEPHAEYNAQPDDCHAHSRDDNHGVDFWRRAPVTDAQYRRVLAERAILEVKVSELQAANNQLEIDVDALTLQAGELSATPDSDPHGYKRTIINLAQEYTKLANAAQYVVDGWTDDDVGHCAFVNRIEALAALLPISLPRMDV